MRKYQYQSDNYTEEELRRTLIERYRNARQFRLRRFQRFGKIQSKDFELTSQRSSTRYSKDQDRRKQSPFSNFIKVFEIGLLLVILFMGVSGWNSLGKLNRKTRSNWEIPAVTPTPLITPVVLPSGHSQNTVPIQVYSNIPYIHGLEGPREGYLPFFEQPTPEPEFAIRIVIPTIRVDAPIVLGVESDQLKRGVGQVPGSANPGQKGNLVLSAHNDIYGELFRYLDQLKTGDQFTVYTNIQAYTYSVTDWELVEPTRVDVLAPTPNPTATLISCYPYLIDTLRIVVRANLVEG
jgi:sortase A